jgi:hypothetical protein
MRTKTLEVPADIIVEFSSTLGEYELGNEITGVNEDGDILIEISYEKEDRDKLFTLTEIIDDYFDEEESEEEEEEEEEPRPSKRKK